MIDDSITELTYQQLQKIKAKLIAKREELKNELKNKHNQAYEWLIKHQIDLDNLQKYSKNIAALVTIVNQLAFKNPILIPFPQLTPAVKMEEETDETISSDNQASQQGSQVVKAQKVWQEYGKIIEDVAQKYNLDPQLIFATIMTESEGNPYAYRYEAHLKEASYGLGQVLYSTAVGKLGFTGKPEDIYRPEIAIDLIGRYHRQTIDTYGELSPERMTVIYNTGKLFGRPTSGHLARFKNWYYNYRKEATLRLPVV